LAKGSTWIAKRLQEHFKREKMGIILIGNDITLSYTATSGGMYL